MFYFIIIKLIIYKIIFIKYNKLINKLYIKKILRLDIYYRFPDSIITSLFI